MSLLNLPQPKIDGWWIIHTGRPFCKLLDPMLDKESKSVQEAVENGSESVADHKLCKKLKTLDYPVENLPYNEKRIKTQCFAEADKNGDFITNDPVLVRKIWAEVQKMPPVDTPFERGLKPNLDPMCHEIPSGEDKPVKK